MTRHYKVFAFMIYSFMKKPIQTFYLAFWCANKGRYDSRAYSIWYKSTHKQIIISLFKHKLPHVPRQYILSTVYLNYCINPRLTTLLNLIPYI